MQRIEEIQEQIITSAKGYEFERQGRHALISKIHNLELRITDDGIKLRDILFNHTFGAARSVNEALVALNQYVDPEAYETVTFQNPSAAPDEIQKALRLFENDDILEATKIYENLSVEQRTMSDWSEFCLCWEASRSSHKESLSTLFPFLKQAPLTIELPQNIFPEKVLTTLAHIKGIVMKGNNLAGTYHLDVPSDDASKYVMIMTDDPQAESHITANLKGSAELVLTPSPQDILYEAETFYEDAGMLDSATLFQWFRESHIGRHFEDYLDQQMPSLDSQAKWTLQQISAAHNEFDQSDYHLKYLTEATRLVHNFGKDLNEYIHSNNNVLKSYLQTVADKCEYAISTLEPESPWKFQKKDNETWPTYALTCQRKGEVLGLANYEIERGLEAFLEDASSLMPQRLGENYEGLDIYSVQGKRRVILSDTNVTFSPEHLEDDRSLYDDFHFEFIPEQSLLNLFTLDGQAKIARIIVPAPQKLSSAELAFFFPLLCRLRRNANPASPVDFRPKGFDRDLEGRSWGDFAVIDIEGRFAVAHLPTGLRMSPLVEEDEAFQLMYALDGSPHEANSPETLELIKRVLKGEVPADWRPSKGELFALRLEAAKLHQDEFGWDLMNVLHRKKARNGDGDLKFGEHIGGSRYDEANETLSLSIAESMNDRELNAYVRKKKIWPVPDYEKMIKDGYSKEAAYLVKKIRDSILNEPPVKIGTYLKRKDEFPLVYLAEVMKVKEVCEHSSAVEELKEAIDKTALYRSDYNQAKFDQGDFKFDISMGTILGKRFTSVVQGLRWNMGKYERELARSTWPKKTEAWLKGIRLYSYRSTKSDEIKWGILKKTSKGTQYLATNLKSERHANEYLENTLRPELEKRRNGLQVKRPPLEHIVREGPDNRQGRNITPDELLETFGFRGGEFGKWQNQSDRRQADLNHAYDAFMDMANILSVPPQTMGIDGLGIAFGARGRGHYAAHYEPSRRVLNLTKTSGAGCLAHEYGHALDDYLGSMASEGRHTYLSRLVKNKPNLRIPNFNEELLEAAKDLMELIHTRSQTASEMKEQIDKDLSHNSKRMENASQWLLDQFRSSTHASRAKRGMKVSEEQLQVFSKVLQEYRNGEGEITEQVSRSSIWYRCPEFEAFFKKAKGINPDRQSIHNFAWLIFNEKRLVRNREKLEAFADHEIVGKSGVNSEFLENSKKMDVNKSKKYWSTSVEMFARAFEAFILDRMEEKEERNDYLVSGAANTAYSEGVSPYPAGDERVAINSAFERFFRAVRVKEENGTVAMYMRRESREQTGLDVPTVSNFLNDYAASLKGELPFKVVQSVTDLPIEIYSHMALTDSMGSPGMYLPTYETCYLVADNLSTIKEALQVVVPHELVHYGTDMIRQRYYDFQDQGIKTAIRDVDGFLLNVFQTYKDEIICHVGEDFFDLSSPVGQASAAEEWIADKASVLGLEEMSIVEEYIALLAATIRKIAEYFGVTTPVLESEIKDFIFEVGQELEKDSPKSISDAGKPCFQ